MMTQLKSPGVNEWTQGPEIGHVVKNNRNTPKNTCEQMQLNGDLNHAEFALRQKLC